MFPHGSYLAGRVAARQASDLVGPDRKALIAWTQVHAIIRSSTCGKKRLSGYDRRLTRCHVELFGAWILLERTMILARVDRAIETVQPT